MTATLRAGLFRPSGIWQAKPPSCWLPRVGTRTCTGRLHGGSSCCGPARRKLRIALTHATTCAAHQRIQVTADEMQSSAFAMHPCAL